jgi:hypothetical protein
MYRVSETAANRLVMSGNAMSGRFEKEMKHVELFEGHIQLLNIKSSGKHVKISVVPYTWEMSSERSHESEGVINVDKRFGKLKVSRA